jgi:hypothetical protein
VTASLFSRFSLWVEGKTSKAGNLEVAVGLEPTKIGFAGQRLDHFGIATKLVNAKQG